MEMCVERHCADYITRSFQDNFPVIILICEWELHKLTCFRGVPFDFHPVKRLPCLLLICCSFPALGH